MRHANTYNGCNVNPTEGEWLMNFEDLTPDQMEKARACKTPEDILQLAREEGFELSEEELNCIVGGDSWWNQCVGPYGECPQWMICSLCIRV